MWVCNLGERNRKVSGPPLGLHTKKLGHVWDQGGLFSFLHFPLFLGQVAGSFIIYQVNWASKYMKNNGKEESKNKPCGMDLELEMNS